MEKRRTFGRNKQIFGVCGGIGETYDIDPTMARIITVLLCLSTGIMPLLLTYFIAWIIMPKAPTRRIGAIYHTLYCWINNAYSVYPWLIQ